MKAKILILALAGALAVTIAVFLWARASYPGCFLTAEEARRRWGDTPFAAPAFRAAAPEERAKQVWSLLKGPEGRAFLREPLGRILEELGPADGHFATPGMAAYKVQAPAADGAIEWNVAFAANTVGRLGDVMVWRETCP